MTLRQFGPQFSKFDCTTKLYIIPYPALLSFLPTLPSIFAHLKIGLIFFWLIEKFGFFEPAHAFHLTWRILCVDLVILKKKGRGPKDAAPHPLRGLTLRDGRQEPGHAFNLSLIFRFIKKLISKKLF